MANGLDYIHYPTDGREPILHRDIKPDNMLLFDGATVLKIADFGCMGKGHRETAVGTDPYKAPEIYGESYHPRAS